MVKTLQQHLDAFDAVRKSRVPASPDQNVLARERAFQDQANKLQQLRLQRMAHHQLVYEVVRHRGHWRILHLNQYSKPFDNQAAAIDAAKRTAREKAKRGHRAEVILRRTDGQSINYALDEPR